MKKRGSIDRRNYMVNEDRKRSKQEQDLHKMMYGDGVAWFRGALIGKGSFGSVFMAKLKNTNANYTYSFYPPIMAVKSAEFSVSGSIQKEKQVLDNIRGCRNVINCYGEEVTNNENRKMVYNLLLEYGSGGTLADLIKRSNGKGLAELDVRKYARSIVRGLSHIHKKGYVHCDLKPDNVLLVESFGKGGGFIAKIGDLGSAKRAKQMIKKRVLCPYCRQGTPRYLSPEAVIKGVQEQPADIWAVGCIVYEMLTGKPLWSWNQDSGRDRILSSIGDYTKLPYISSRISKEGKSFLKCCLCRRVMGRLTANMLLHHPFLHGLLDDDEVEGLQHDVIDINAIASASSFFDEDELWSSSGSGYGLSSWPVRDVGAIENEEKHILGQQIPVRLAIM